jgi:mono/diheme cytochrome c family protein
MGARMARRRCADRAVRLRLFVLICILVGLGVLAGASAGESSRPDPAIRNAAVAPYRDFAHKDAKSLCEDFVPAVAVKLVRSVSADRRCTEAAAEAFARYEVLLLESEPTAIVRTVYTRLGRAWVDLRFPRSQTLRVALRRVAGRWRVSSSVFVFRYTCPARVSIKCSEESKMLGLATIQSPEIAFIPRAARRSGARTLREYEAGSSVAAHSGCLACHRIGEDGHTGPGPNLTHVGARLDEQQLVHALIDPRAPMPSFKRLPRVKLVALTRFLSLLR